METLQKIDSTLDSMQTEEVEYLYHYTSIESLALILKNKTIRLNPLDKMDDLQEQKTADVENLGKFVFVSSWTDDSTESIPMWKMYTNSTAGVRIKLRKNPFLWHGTHGEDIERALGIPPVNEESKQGFVKTFLDYSKLIAGGYFSPQAWGGQILEKITYTNDQAKLEPKVGKFENGQIELKIGDLGKFKNTHWEFQQEWRYIMSFTAMDFKASMEEMPKLFSQRVLRLLQGVEIPPFRYYDLDIDPRYFEEMEITCSPQMTYGNRVILETLVEKYNPNAKIVDSELLGKI